MKSEQSSDEIAAAMADLIQPKTQFSTSSAQADFITLVTSSQNLFWDFIQRSLRLQKRKLLKSRKLNLFYTIAVKFVASWFLQLQLLKTNKVLSGLEALFQAAFCKFSKFEGQHFYNSLNKLYSFLLIYNLYLFL